MSASAPPVVRKRRAAPVDMVHLFETLDRAGGLFVQERYREAIPLLRAILQADPFNLDAALRLATSYSSLGQDAVALEAFKKAATIAPRSPDVRVYLALHYARGKDWPQAVPMLEKIVAETPEKQPAVEALALIRVRQGRQAMENGQTAAAISALRGGSPVERISVYERPGTWCAMHVLPGGCSTRGSRSTACRRRILITRWRSSSVPR